MNRLCMYRGMVIREGTIDDNIVRQVWDDYGLLDFRGMVVLDGGAHIGAFTDMAARKLAKKIIAFEPEIENARLFSMNHGESDMYIHFYFQALVQSFISSSSSPIAKLYVHRAGENRGMHTLLDKAMEDRGIFEYQEQACRVHSIDVIVSKYQPDIIKLDIEGSEIGVFPFLLSDKNSATQMAIEFHAFNEEMKEANINFVAGLLAQGWEAVKQPAVNAGHQATVGVFKR